jgi:hypothetical protein
VTRDQKIMNFDHEEMAVVTADMTVEELKIKKQEFEEINEKSFKSIKKLNEVLLEKLEKGPEFPSVTEKSKRLQELILKLSELIAEKLEISKSIEAKHQALMALYKKNKEEAETCPIIITDIESTASQKELQVAKNERDKALGLVKILLATLKSSRMQSEENFHKQKYSSDLMFHIMYKAEDAFLGGEDRG